MGFAALYGVERLRSRAAIQLLILAAQGEVMHSAILFGYDDKANVIKVNNVFLKKDLRKKMRYVGSLV